MASRRSSRVDLDDVAPISGDEGGGGGGGGDSDSGDDGVKELAPVSALPPTTEPVGDTTSFDGLITRVPGDKIVRGKRRLPSASRLMQKGRDLGDIMRLTATIANAEEDGISDLRKAELGRQLNEKLAKAGGEAYAVKECPSIIYVDDEGNILRKKEGDDWVPYVRRMVAMPNVLFPKKPADIDEEDFKKMPEDCDPTKVAMFYTTVGTEEDAMVSGACYPKDCNYEHLIWDNAEARRLGERALLQFMGNMVNVDSDRSVSIQADDAKAILSGQGDVDTAKKTMTDAYQRAVRIMYPDHYDSAAMQSRIKAQLAKFVDTAKLIRKNMEHKPNKSLKWICSNLKGVDSDGKVTAVSADNVVKFIPKGKLPEMCIPMEVFEELKNKTSGTFSTTDARIRKAGKDIAMTADAALSMAEASDKKTTSIFGGGGEGDIRAALEEYRRRISGGGGGPGVDTEYMYRMGRE